jgi:hypothetical protein
MSIYALTHAHHGLPTGSGESGKSMIVKQMKIIQSFIRAATLVKNSSLSDRSFGKISLRVAKMLFRR